MRRERGVSAGRGAQQGRVGHGMQSQDSGVLSQQWERNGDKLEQY